MLSGSLTAPPCLPTKRYNQNFAVGACDRGRATNSRCCAFAALLLDDIGETRDISIECRFWNGLALLVNMRLTML